MKIEDGLTWEQIIEAVNRVSEGIQEQFAPKLAEVELIADPAMRVAVRKAIGATVARVQYIWVEQLLAPLRDVDDDGLAESILRVFRVMVEAAER